LSGGDISLVSLAFNLKVNFVPVKDNSVISIYAFAKPFIANASRSDVSGFGEYYYDASTSAPVADPTNNDTWDKSIPGLEGLGAKSSITGGIFLGPGIELFPAKKVSFFLQASFGYTFNTNLVSTRSYGNDYAVDYKNIDFPLKDLGFSSINFAGGISFNLD
jgi:hypothetical protein